MVRMCRFPFTDCPGCDKCTCPPVIELPPPQEALRTKGAALAFVGGALAIIALVAFSGPMQRMSNVNSEYQEMVK